MAAAWETCTKKLSAISRQGSSPSPSTRHSTTSFILDFAFHCAILGIDGQRPLLIAWQACPVIKAIRFTEAPLVTAGLLFLATTLERHDFIPCRKSGQQ